MKTVLVVDDERCVRQLYRDAFEGEGYAVLEADGAEPAIRMLRSTDVDLAVLDIHMPQTHGLELLARIHRSWPRLPAIICSAFPKLFDDYAVWDAGAQVVGLFAKPVDLAALLECAGRALDGAVCPVGVEGNPQFVIRNP